MRNRLVASLLLCMFSVPTLLADDKDPPSPGEQYKALVDEYTSAQREFSAASYWQAFALLPAIDDDLRKSLGQAVSGERSMDESLRKLVQSSENSLRYLHRGARVKACSWGIAYESGPYAMLPHLTKARDLARIALLRARMNLEKGQADEAADDIIAAVTLARHAGREGVILLISILVDYAIEYQAMVTVADFLPKLSAQQCQLLQRRLDAVPQGGDSSAGGRL